MQTIRGLHRLSAVVAVGAAAGALDGGRLSLERVVGVRANLLHTHPAGRKGDLRIRERSLTYGRGWYPTGGIVWRW